jgi:hypothetical protein
MIFAALFFFNIYLMASSDFLESLAPKIIVHCRLESSLMVSLPMPVLAPVITITLSVRSLSPVQVPPREKSLMAVRTAKVEDTMMAPVGVATHVFRLLKYYIIYLWSI